MPIRLDERLSYIASLVKGGTVADIGCDHGKLSYFLVSAERADRAIATDISAKSLQKARELAFSNGVGHLVETRVGDGLGPLASGEADVVIIAGLGGDVISGILMRAHAEGKRFESYILSPNTHPEKARATLNAVGQRIILDRMVVAGGKSYTVLQSRRGEQTLDELQLLFGAFYAEDAQFKRRAEQELKYIRQMLERQPSAQKLKDRAALIERALQNCREAKEDENEDK